MNYLVYYLKGTAMGIANAVPGVSGGTIAVITKIYDKLVDAISLNFKKLKKNFLFLLCVLLGMATGIIAAAFLLEFLFRKYNVPTQFFFIGIILGSMPLIYKESTKDNKIKAIHILPFIIGIAAILSFGLLKEDVFSVSGSSIPLPVLAIMGFFAAVAMVIPGISGALVLKILGGYDITMTAITDFNFPIIIAVGIGAILGVLCSAKIISILFKKWKTGTYCFIMGLIIASVPQVYPKEFSFNIQGIVAVFTLLIGLVIPVMTEKLSVALKKE